MPVKIFANEDLQQLENDVNDWLIETSEIRMREEASSQITYIEGKFIYVIAYVVKPKYK